MNQDNRLSNFGQERVKRIGTEKAIQYDARVGEYADYRYSIALLVALANVGLFISFLVVLVLGVATQDFGAIALAGAMLGLCHLLKRLSEWLTPNEVDF